MSDELERLRADLEVIKRLRGQESSFWTIGQAETLLTEEIARLEAEAADPWREAKERIERWRRLAKELGGMVVEKEMVEYVDHLTAERDRLTKRVAELEDAVDQRDRMLDDWREAANTLALESESIQIPADLAARIDDLYVSYPILDPSRVLKTAVRILKSRGDGWIAACIDECFSAAKPYRLKGGDGG